jgi:hypothetical protein
VATPAISHHVAFKLLPLLATCMHRALLAVAFAARHVPLPEADML